MADAAEGLAKARAFGRSIGDFSELNDAEKEVVAKTCQGEVADFGKNVPATDEERVKRKVQARLVRFLALGGDNATAVHERGVQIQGAVIDGDLDLEGCTLVCDLSLVNCELAGTLTLRGARTRTVNLAGSTCRDIEADGVEISGNFDLRDGFVATGAVSLNGAKISGSLACDGARFAGRHSDGYALGCDSADVAGYILLRGASTVNGGVWLLGAKVGANLECDRGRFEGRNNNGDALICSLAKVSGGIAMRDGFFAGGLVRIVGAAIGSDVACNGGTFGAEPQAAHGAEGKRAEITKVAPAALCLDLSRATVAGTLWLTRTQDATFRGGVGLTGAKISRIADAVRKGTERRAPDGSPVGAGKSPAFLLLDGLIYDRFGELTDLSAAARISFLRLQSADDLGADFKPQPWVQMVNVLREMGHEEEAKAVAIEKQKALRQAGKIAGIAGYVHDAYGLLYGYGYQPLRLGASAAVFALLCALWFWQAAEGGVMEPTDRRLVDDGQLAACRQQPAVNWTKCDELQYRYTAFNSFLYSLELILPIGGARQTKDWAPRVTMPCAETSAFDICWRSMAETSKNSAIQPKPGYSPFGVATAVLAWLENLFGWLAGLMFVAIASGLIKKD